MCSADRSETLRANRHGSDRASPCRDKRERETRVVGLHARQSRAGHRI